MANKNLFNDPVRQAPKVDTVNQAGGLAHSLSAEHALAQYVVTGTFNQTYYASASEQLDEVKNLVGGVRSEMIAKIAVYGHQEASMKDIPAYLLAVLAARGDVELLRAIFPKVITNVKMLLNFVQIVRSGETGRKSFGSAIKRLIQEWIISKPNDRLFRASIGHDQPSLADVIKMTHPKPTSPEQNALLAYLLDKPYKNSLLPKLVKQVEVFKVNNRREVPDIPFMALSNYDLTKEQWIQVGRNMPWNTLRMNLNQLSRHDVFDDAEFTSYVANTLSDPELVRKYNVFPYQLLTAYLNASANIPKSVQSALHDAMEVATENIPSLDTNVAVCVDQSGSMTNPVTGNRFGSTTVTTCKQVAALIASAFARTNPNCEVVAWASDVKTVDIDPRDTVITNCGKISQIDVGHGTNAELSIRHLNQYKWKGNAIIIVSDNQSWMGRYSDKTGLQRQWIEYKKHNPKARLVCLDIQPYGNTQIPDDKDVLNIGGFNDSVFRVVEDFIKRGNVNFIDIIKEITL